MRHITPRLLWALLVLLPVLPAANAGSAADELDAALAELKTQYPGFAAAFEAELRKDAPKLETIATFRKHQQAIGAFDPANAASLESASAALRELYSPGAKGNFENIHWVLQKSSIISAEHSAKIAEIRNHMVDLTMRDMAKLLGEVCKVDFSKAKHALNDIDHTFRALEGRNVPGAVQKQIFEYLFKERWKIEAPKMDVVSHPGEARIPDWKDTRASMSEMVVQLKKGSAFLRNNDEAYFVEGATRFEVERRAFDADARLVSIYTYNERTQRHGPVLEVMHAPRAPGAGDVDVAEVRADEFMFSMKPPEVRESFGWDISLGNFWFYLHHGKGVRFASKYGGRSFAGSVGMRVQLLNPQLLGGEKMKTYAELQDLSLKEKIFSEAYDQDYTPAPAGAERGERRGLGISKEDLRRSLVTASAIREAKDTYGDRRPEILKPMALYLAGSEEAYKQNPEAWNVRAETHVEGHMERMMLYNLEITLPARVKDWVHPVVNPRVLGFTEEQIRENGPDLQKALKTAERKMSRAALFALSLGLNRLPAEIRNPLIASVREQFKSDGVLDYALQKLQEFSSKDLVGWLNSEVERIGAKENPPQRKSITVEGGGKLVVEKPGADTDAAAEFVEKQVLADAEIVLDEMRKAQLTELKGAELRVMAAQSIALRPGTPEFERARERARMTKLQAVEQRLMKTRPGQLLMRPITDWKLIEELDFTQGLVPRVNREAMLKQVLDWGNVDSVITILDAFYEYRKNPEAPDAAKAVLKAVAWEMASICLPILNTATAIVEAGKGNLEPGLLIGVSLAIPQVGVAMMAYNVGKHAWDFNVKVGYDVVLNTHYQGLIPDKAGQAPRQGFVSGELPPGILHPAFEDLKRVRKELQARLVQMVDPESRQAIETELSDLSEDFDGVRNHLFTFYQAKLDAQLKPPATPLDEWHAILLSGGEAVAGNENDYANLPRRMTAYFMRQVEEYLGGKGKYEPFKAALQHPVIRENYLCSEDGKRAGSNEGFKERLIGALVIAYRDSLRARIQKKSDFRLKPALTLPVTDKPLETEALIWSCLEGRKAERVLDRVLKRGPHTGDVPELPSILAPVPGDTYEEKLENFFSYHDGILTAALRGRKEKGLEVPPEEQWDRWKLGLDDAEAAPAGDAVHLKFTPIMTFFKDVVKEYRLKNSGNLPLALNEAKLQQQMVEQFTLDYRKGLIQARQRAAEEQLRIAERRRLQFHAKMNRILDFMAGGDDAARKKELHDLAIHSGDPVCAAEGLDEFVQKIVREDKPGFEIKILPPAGGLAPGRPGLFRCEVKASRHYLRPFTFEWSMSSDGKQDEAVQGKVGGLFQGRLLRLGNEIPRAGTQIAVLVKDARGVPLGPKKEVLVPSSVPAAVVPVLSAGAKRAAGLSPILGNDYSVLFHYKHSGRRDPQWPLEEFESLKEGNSYRFPTLYRVECNGDRTFMVQWDTFTPGVTPRPTIFLPGQVDEGEPGLVYLRQPGKFKARLVAISGPNGKVQQSVEFDVEMREPDPLPTIKPEDLPKRQQDMAKSEAGLRAQWAKYQQTRAPADLKSTMGWFSSILSGYSNFYGDAYLVKNWAALLEQHETYAAPYRGDYVAMAAAQALATKATLLTAGHDLARMNEFMKTVERSIAGLPQKDRDVVMREVAGIPIGLAYRYARDYMDNERAEEQAKRIEGLTDKYNYKLKEIREYYPRNTKLRAFFPAEAFK